MENSHYHWLSYNGLYLSVVTQQYNAAVAAFILFTFILVERKKIFGLH